MSEHTTMATLDNMPRRYSYSVVPSVFLQSLPSTDTQSFDFTRSNFGLIPPPDIQEGGLLSITTQWQQLEDRLHHLNSSATAGTSYKLLYLARHGQGTHNLASAHYGIDEWESYVAKQDFDPIYGRLLDPPLTPAGVAQVEQARDFFLNAIPQGVPVPDAWFVSPLERCLSTAQLTWLPLLQKGVLKEWKPMVKEGIREILGVHTCDRRSVLSSKPSKYPEMEFEAGMSEEDELWKPDYRETFDELDVRAQTFMDEVWDRKEGEQVVSVTSHSCWIRSALRVLGHREFKLRTGEVLPILVKGVSNSNL